MGNSLHIHHLSLLCGSGAAAASRLAVERLLGTADLNPPCLPPSAVLIVRHMRDPMPGHLARSRSAVRADMEWERRVRGQLTELTRRAVLPVHGPVPAGAHAVLFLDESELLACLAIDVRRGAAQKRWWWRSFFRNAGDRAGGGSEQEAGAALARRMMCRPQSAVAAVAWLAHRGMSGDALMALTSLQAAKVLAAISDAYHLSAIRLSPTRPAVPPSSTAAVQPPWDTAPVPPGFGRERTALLGLSVDLHTRPAAVHTREYQLQASAWWQAAASGQSASVSSDHRPPGTAVTSAPPGLWEAELLPAPVPPVHRTVTCERLSRGEEADIDPARADHAGFHDVASEKIGSAQEAMPEPQLLPDGPRKQFRSDATSRADRRETRAETPFPVSRSPKPVEEPSREQSCRKDVPRFLSPPLTPRPDTSQQQGGEAPRGGAGVEEVRHPSFLPQGTVDPVQERWGPALDEVSPLGLRTRLGGVLYLINMMAVLDLPGCFETGWRLASRVGAWGTLDALGRELLGDELRRLRDDPLWSALAHLDGRKQSHPPGSRLPRSRPRRWPAFNLPPQWLIGLPKLDLVPLSRARLGRISTAYPPLLAGWLGRVLPFISARLRLALRLAPEASLPHSLLLVPGTFYLTPSNLDLVASIESISLPARMAGLDADPGWVPEFGRFIRFHFE